MGTLKIRQFRYSADNLGYVVYGNSLAMAIDPGAADDMVSFTRSRGIELKYVVNTHSHSDHTWGNGRIARLSGAEFLDNMTLRNKGVIELDGAVIDIRHTPGHSADSIVFLFDNILVAGDTLFNGKVGRCFTGDLRGFYHSIKEIMALPRETIIYAGHDYVEEYMENAKKIEPDNQEIDDFLERYNSDHVRSTLEDELRINAFIRFNDEKIVTMLRDRGLTVDTEYDRWESIMSIH